MTQQTEQWRGKLVRNRIPDICLANGQEPITYIAGPEEYLERLVEKFGEEGTELTEAIAEAAPGHVAEEAADVLEVVYAIAAHYGIDAEQLEKIRAEKARERGGFGDRIVWVGNR